MRQSQQRRLPPPSMYTNLIYFVVALLVYATCQPSLAPRFTAAMTILGSVGLFAAFWAITRLATQRLRRQLQATADPSQQALRCHRVLGQLGLLGLLFYCLHLYLLDLKFYLASMPLFRLSFTLQGLAALGLLGVYLGLTWVASQQVGPKGPTAAPSWRTNLLPLLRLNLALLLPWMLISGVFDLIELLPLPPLQDLFDTPAGQVLFFLTFLTLFMFFGPPLVLRLWGCRPLPPSADLHLIESFSREQGVRLRATLLWPFPGRRSYTAGIMGIHPRYRYLLVTPELLSLLNPAELRAVLAHEFGHIKYRHLFFYILFLAGYLVVAYSTFDLSVLLVLSSNAIAPLVVQTDAGSGALVSLLASLPLLLLLVFYFRYLFGFFVRNFERQADLYSLVALGTPIPLVSALEKVARAAGNIRHLPSWHHFSIAERVDYLLRAATDPDQVRHHHRLLQWCLSGYLLLLLGVGGFGYLAQNGGLVANLDQRLAIRLLSKKAALEPENSAAHLALGTLYYQRRQLAAAVDHLEAAVALAPRDADALNNLAWILVTSADSPYYQPRRGLQLALQAAALAPRAPYILDTLAEAYHANGRHQEALATAQRALGLASKNKKYYREQVARFQAAAESWRLPTRRGSPQD